MNCAIQEERYGTQPCHGHESLCSNTLFGQAEQLLRLRKLPVKEAFCSAGLPSTRDIAGSNPNEPLTALSVGFGSDFYDSAFLDSRRNCCNREKLIRFWQPKAPIFDEP